MGVKMEIDEYVILTIELSGFDISINRIQVSFYPFLYPPGQEKEAAYVEGQSKQNYGKQ